MVRKELQERAEVALPPYYRFITIELNSKEASSQGWLVASPARSPDLGIGTDQWSI